MYIYIERDIYMYVCVYIPFMYIYIEYTKLYTNYHHHHHLHHHHHHHHDSCYHHRYHHRHHHDYVLYTPHFNNNN